MFAKQMVSRVELRKWNRHSKSGRHKTEWCRVENCHACVQSLIQFKNYWTPTMSQTLIGQNSEHMFSNGWLTGEGGSGMDEKGEGE